MQKRAVFYDYVIFWVQSGQAGIENGAMLTTYLFRYTSECTISSSNFLRDIPGSTHHHHQFHVADEGRRVVAPPCPRSTARLQRSPIGRVESFRSWSTHLFRGRPGGRRHVRSGGRLSTLMWSWRAMFAGVTSPSRATCPNTEMRRLDRRWDSEVRPVCWSTSSFRTRSYQLIPSSCSKTDVDYKIGMPLNLQ